MSRIPYTFTRDSIAAVIDPNAESRLVQAGIPVVGYPGVRGGGGFLIMPAVTQVFYDNYFSNQTLDAAVGAPWTVAGTNTVRDENTLLGGLSFEAVPGGTTPRIYQTKTLSAAAATLSAYIYCPPPVLLGALRLWWEGAFVVPSGIVSLGGYWYFIWYSATAAGTAQQYGVGNYSNTGDPSIWVDCLSLTQTAAPVGFVPNSQTAATQASADDNLKFTLSEPLPQSGAISFVYIPFYDNDGSAIDTYPSILTFLPSGGNSLQLYKLRIAIRDTSSVGFEAYVNNGGSESNTSDGGRAATGFTAFTPIEIVFDWDLAPGGTKLLRFWANGELQVESSGIGVIPNNLVDMWVGVERTGASAWAQHAQGILMDIQVHKRG